MSRNNQRQFLALSLAILAGCGGRGGGSMRDDGVTDDAATESGTSSDAMSDAMSEAASDVPSAGDAMSAGACSASNRAACAYQPQRTFMPVADVVLQQLSYTDAIGMQRTIEVAVRRPMGAPQPMPVIVWSHGGADGQMSARNVGAEWADVFVRAGYLFVGIAHTPRSDASRAALCMQFGITATADCARFKYLHYDRPYDLRRVLDWIEMQARGMFAGTIDPQRILYAGHSAGAGSTSMVAGASRDFNGMTRTAPDPRPRAFIGFSVEGPNDDGFTDASFPAIMRPHMSVTGVGDTTGESDPAQRRRVFELVSPGQKYRFWMTDAAAQHGTFDHNEGPCESYQMRRGQPVALCQDIYRWMESAALAFADAQLRERPEAIAWLASNNAAVLSNSVVEWSRR